MYTSIDESVQVIASFAAGRVTPRVFRWHGRDYKVVEIAIRYEERSGSSLNYFFGLETDNGNTFKLVFNSTSLIWTLLEVWND